MGDKKEGGLMLINSSMLSAWSILVALVGVSLNAIFTKPYAGAAELGSREKEKLYNLRIRVGKIANILIVIGTAGQLGSIVAF